MSWIVRRRDTGAAILETFSARVAEKINRKVYEVVPALQHLQELNRPGTKARRAMMENVK